MRAHMALKYSGLKVELREVDLKNMPDEALLKSAKATVPILVLADVSVIDESWDIMKWALAQNDPDNWLDEANDNLLAAEILTETNDFSFKADLDHYKYANRYPEQSEEYYRVACEEFIEELEDMLTENKFLLTNKLTLADISVFPFVRQFSLVNKAWFNQAPYPKVQIWLDILVNSALFQHLFQKHDVWKAGNSAIYI
jgi:glutathione S-transferase